MVSCVMEMLREEKLEEIGKVAHYFTKIEVAVIDLTAPLSVGDRITIKGATTDFEQTVDSMQIEHENVETAKAGDSIGLRVDNRVREGDVVYKIV
jgi:translation elongation factor EF-1alpha